MRKEIYQIMTEPFRIDKEMVKAIHKCNKLITGLMFLLYPVLLLYFLLQRDVALAKAIIVPLDGFIIVTVFRYLINRPRPYEAFQMEPVIQKDTKGKSFPSRHVFSATMIAMTYLLLSPWAPLGWFLLVIAVCLGAVRVIGGIHYISDVVAGILLGVLAGVIGYIVF